MTAALATGTASANALTVRVDRKTFPPAGDRPAETVLKDITLTIEPRSFVVITGPSGCGKSTLLNIVAGLDRDYDGEVSFGSQQSSLGYIFQSPRLLPWRTIEDNIRLALPDGDPKLAGIPDMLRQVGLTAAASQYPERVSLGMQRRAALARGFITEPDILLMDEPFVSLDDPTAQSLRELLIALWNRRPTTVLFVTHDRSEAVMLATRILRLAGPGATIVADEAVLLSAAERTDRDKVLAEQRRIFHES